MVVSHIWPVGIHRIGSNIYFFFMVVNLICVPIIWLLYPETKGRPLEDMDVLFGGGPTVSVGNLEDRESMENLLGSEDRMASTGPKDVAASRQGVSLSDEDG